MCSSHSTGCERTSEFRSKIFAHFGSSSLKLRKVPTVPWQDPWARKTVSPFRNVSDRRLGLAHPVRAGLVACLASHPHIAQYLQATPSPPLVECRCTSTCSHPNANSQAHIRNHRRRHPATKRRRAESTARLPNSGPCSSAAPLNPLAHRNPPNANGER